MNNYKFLKVIISGDRRTGKSTLTSRLSNKELDKEYNTTIGVEFSSRYLQELDLKVNIWDLGGEHRFENITVQYFKIVSIIVFVYSIDSYDSFLRIQELYKRYIEDGTINSHKIIVVCNKFDLINETNKPLLNQGIDWANYISAGFISVSAKENTNVTGLFNSLLIMGDIKIKEKEEKKDNFRKCILL